MGNNFDNKQQRFPKHRTNDPQIVVEGRLKQGENADTITFHLNEGLFERVFIVTIPPDGEDSAPVYIKHKLHPPQQPIDYRNVTTPLRRTRRPNEFRRDNDVGDEETDSREASSL